MGWTSTHLYRGQSITEYLKKQFTFKSEQASYKVLDSSLIRFHTWYAAIEKTCLVSSEKEVLGVVVLVKTSPRSEYNFYYKDISEESGPCECECPLRILNLLTPTTNQYALKWRQECKNNSKKPKKPSLKKDHYILFEEPITFSDDKSFRLMKVFNPRRRWFYGKDGRHLYRIPNTKLNKMEYKIMDLDNIPHDDLPTLIGDNPDLNRWIQERINIDDHTTMA